MTGAHDEEEPAKAALRRTARTLRRGLDAAHRSSADAVIVQRLVDVVGELEASLVGLYAALAGEVDLDGAVAPLQAVGVEVAYPRIVDPGTMRFHLVGSPPVVPRGTPAIREPEATAPVVVPDLVVLPGLAFDRDGGRLGYGAGYYDRWLARHPGVQTVGVCHAQLLVPAVPLLPHDVRAYAVLTEDGVYR